MTRIVWKVTSVDKCTDKEGYALMSVEDITNGFSRERIRLKLIDTPGSCQDGVNVIRMYKWQDAEGNLYIAGALN